MNRAQRQLLRQYAAGPQVNVPFTLAFWTLYGLVVASLLHYLGVF